MDNKLVSAIITTYKRPPDIVRRAIDSVLNQTYENLELIVVDDSPASFEQRDDVRRLVESVASFEQRKGVRNLVESAVSLEQKGNVSTPVEGYRGRKVVYIPHEKNMGACVARNTGLHAAGGEYVAYLDDDDEWFPEKIEKQIAAFAGDIGLVYCRSKIYNDTTGETKLRIAPAPFQMGMVYDALIKNNFIGSTSFPLIKKSVLEEVGGFDPEMRSAQDYDVWLRIAKNYAVTYVDAPLALYHEHSGEQISTNIGNKLQGLERLTEKNIDYLKEHKDAWSLRLMKMATLYAMTDRKRALKMWRKASALNPAGVKENARYLKKIMSQGDRFH